MAVKVTRFRPGKKPLKSTVTDAEWRRESDEVARAGGMIIDLLPDGTLHYRISESVFRKMKSDARRMGMSVQEMLQQQLEALWENEKAKR